MMFDFKSPLFWYKLLFMAELLVSEALFAIKLRRRDSFILRIFFCIAGLFAVAFLMPIVAYNAVWTSFMFISFFVFTLIAMKICFNESWWNVLFCGLAAYTVQHLSYVIYSGIMDLLAQLVGYVQQWNPYSGIEYGGTVGPPVLVTAVVYAFSYLLFYWMAYYIYSDRINPREELKLGNTRFVLLAGIIILTAIIFSLFSQYSGNENLTMRWLERGYSLLTCVMALQLQFSQLTEKEMQKKLNTVQQILFEEQKQYEVVKENVDIINLKCHDLKQQIRTLRLKDQEVDKDELKEIENAINIYESVVKTGNETLDLILTDKNLVCKKKGIRLTCIADGAQLDFIKPADIYALFGNALDNAMGAVSALPETNRNISLHIKSIGNMISVHIENCFTGTLDIKNGLPATTKENRNYHGYGMLSIKTVTEKYGGNLSFETVNNIFNLNILFNKNNL